LFLDDQEWPKKFFREIAAILGENKSVVVSRF